MRFGILQSLENKGKIHQSVDKPELNRRKIPLLLQKANFASKMAFFFGKQGGITMFDDRKFDREEYFTRERFVQIHWQTVKHCNAKSFI